jgi:hypothetical protein
MKYDYTNVKNIYIVCDKTEMRWIGTLIQDFYELILYEDFGTFCVFVLCFSFACRIGFDLKYYSHKSSKLTLVSIVKRGLIK